LDLELSRQIIRFHQSRHIRPRYGRSFVNPFGTRYRWCFSDLSTARNFVEEFGGEFWKPTSEIVIGIMHQEPGEKISGQVDVEG
jgi:hypothetical protein